MNLDNIFPLIVPASLYNQNANKMCQYKLANEEFTLCWVALEEGEPMEYVTPYFYKTLDKKYPGWQADTFENLRLSINENEISFTQHKMSSDGKRIIFIVFLNADGIGSSRVLLRHELTTAFPSGYYIALPDRSCGMIIAKNITQKELEATTKLVSAAYKKATTPMSALLHAAEGFTLPAEWVTPGDEEFSKEMTDEIESLRRVKR